MEIPQSPGLGLLDTAGLGRQCRNHPIIQLNFGFCGREMATFEEAFSGDETIFHSRLNASIKCRS